MFEYLKICAVCVAVVAISYFAFEAPLSFDYPNIDVQADISTTSVSVGNASPTVSSIFLNSGEHIDLIEDNATTVVATATVSDTNTYSNIVLVTGKLYRAGVSDGYNCIADGNNCYVDSACATSSCSSNDCVATCQFNVWFIAEPTDAGSYSGQSWDAFIEATDASSATGTATNTVQAIDVKSLTAMNVSETVAYGTLAPGVADASTTNLVLATTTGNEAIDGEISGTIMCTDYPGCSAYRIDSIAQHYATSTVDFGDGYVLSSTTPAALEFDTIKPNATPSNQAQNIYWGISVPGGQAAGDYEGENTFTAVSD
ncbi:MAG: hypothetical protein V1697_02555 [Candidatus Levyibacteriota bacterium]